MKASVRSSIFAVLVAGCCNYAVATPDLVQQVDELFAPWARSDSAGCAMAVTEEGRILLERGYGMADLEQGVAIRPDTVFNMASVSKQFASTAILLLAEEGKLSLDDDVRKYVPELRDYGKTITLRMLGNHTSGLRDYPELLALGGWNWVDEIPVAKAIDIMARQKRLDFTPGSKYSYSNSGYLLLGVIVERVSGQTLGAYADQHIFKPLGMLHSRFYDDRRMIMKNRAIGHIKGDDGTLGVWRPTYEVVGDGALLTTVQDMALWERNFIEPRLGRDPQRLIAQLVEPGRLNDGSRTQYGFGLVIDEYRGLPTVGHSGGVPGYATHMLRFPQQRFSVQVMCNQGRLPAGKLAKSVADLYLEGKFTSAAVVPPASADAAAAKEQLALAPGKLAEYAGAFYSDELDATHVVRVDGDALSITVGYLPAQRWIAVGTDRFESADGMSIVFTRGNGRKVNGYTLSTEVMEGFGFKATTGQRHPR